MPQSPRHPIGDGHRLRNPYIASILLLALQQRGLKRLAVDIAADINNSLLVVALAIEQIDKAPDAAGPSRLPTDEILSAATRIQKATRMLLSVVDTHKTPPSVFSVDETVVAIYPLLRCTLRPDISFIMVSADNLWLAKGEPGAVELCALELTLRANTSIASGGRFEMDLSNIRLASRLAKLEPGDYVQVRVSMAGGDAASAEFADVSRAAVEKLSNGTPAGSESMTCADLIDENRGHITYETTPEGGAIITILLPRG